jgi:hypothetical protein
MKCRSRNSGKISMRRIAGLLAVLGLAGVCVLPEPAPATRPASKKLIEFGWDEPDPSFMRAHIREMENTPFNGVVFHANYVRQTGEHGNFTWECWGKRAFTDEDLASALNDLKATSLHRLRYNFLRFNVTPGDVDWFDDFGAVLNNARVAARFAQRSGSTGILFDVEEYKSKLFSYRSRRYSGSKSWAEYASQARLRGAQIAQAFQREFPNIRVFLTYGYELPWKETRSRGKAQADTDYGLLAPFLDGMIEVAAGMTLIDGFETAYAFTSPTDFSGGYDTMSEQVLPIVANREKYRRIASFGFGIWMDYRSQTKGWNESKLTDNPHSPNDFQNLLQAALNRTDEYVWIYTQVPRWWSKDGKSQHLPESYRRAVYNAVGAIPR